MLRRTALIVAAVASISACTGSGDAGSGGTGSAPVAAPDVTVAPPLVDTAAPVDIGADGTITMQFPDDEGRAQCFALETWDGTAWVRTIWGVRAANEPIDPVRWRPVDGCDDDEGAGPIVAAPLPTDAAVAGSWARFCDLDGRDCTQRVRLPERDDGSRDGG